jgi:glycogen debranching enzyme
MLERAVLKENQMFLVSDLSGDVLAQATDGQGLYFRDTRHLSVYEFCLSGARPQHLSSSGELNFMTNLQLANPAMLDDLGQPLAPRTVSVRRNRFLRDGLHERIGLFNYNPFPIRLTLRLIVGADFRDMFDVRGYAPRAARGTIHAPQVLPNGVRLSYTGLDGLERWTDLSCDPGPSQVLLLKAEPAVPGESLFADDRSALPDSRVEPYIPTPRAELQFPLDIPAKRYRNLTIHLVPRLATEPRAPADDAPALDAAFLAVRETYQAWDASCTRISTDNQIFNAMLLQASHDLRLLSDDSGQGLVPSAGIPWFAVPFGRDSLVVAAQTLSLQPSLAYGTLRFLAARQGTRINHWRDEEPGKILHEVRAGEMAALEEVPHLTYYGSVDSTPLFLAVLGELLDWTADEAFAREMLPHAEAALEWIDRYGDLDGDGYLEYHSRSRLGIRNQGWKDSHDSVCYRDGREVEPPIALVEVQGYVYAAKRRMAALFARLGMLERAAELNAQAQALAERFERDFWLSDEQFYALALDPAKQPVPSITSNPGHCLWSGLVRGARAEMVGRRLMSDDMLCGWGVRTLSAMEPTFNPMSYHNGSVWPHDNSLVAAGLKAAGLDEYATRVGTEVLEAGMRMPGLRLPELYCGFARDRRYHSLPARYPVSCSPQSWAAGSVFLFLQTFLGLRVDAWTKTVVLRPLLPPWLSRVSLRGLRVGEHRLDLDVFQSDGPPRLEVGGDGALRVELETVGALAPAGAGSAG